MSKVQERRSKLLSILSQKGTASCRELVSGLGVSEMTVRRDISELLASKVIMRGLKSGTFILAGQNIHAVEDYESTIALARNIDEKDRIGRFAASLVKSGDSIIVDSGSTTVKLANHISDDLCFSALCYSYQIFEALRTKRNAEINLVGGILNNATMSFNSSEGPEIISRFRANKMFMSASGVHENLGITCGYRSEIPNKIAAINSSISRILLVNSSKFDYVRPAYVSELNVVDTLITDDGIPEEWKERIIMLGIKLYIV